jgi:hypothetical protein
MNIDNNDILDNVPPAINTNMNTSITPNPICDDSHNQ